MIPHWMSRTELLLGAEKIDKLRNANVLVVGLGGVGGICAEMIARAGVGKMTIVDGDDIEASNINRQVPALISTEGKLKATVMGERIRDINPDIDLTIIPEYLKGPKVEGIVESTRFDYAVDCIDTLTPKVFFIKACLDNKIPIVSSMGAGGKVDPLQVRVTDISKTYNCHLAYYVRKRLHRLGIYDGIQVVSSTEQADKSKVILAPEGSTKKSIIGTISYMPAIFGITCASVVIRNLYSR